MQLARVAGTVVASRKEQRLEGLKFLLLEQLGTDNKPTGSYVVAADAVGAGLDEVVMYASGSSARQTEYTDARPVDAVVMAIVDSWEVDGKDVWQK